MAPDRLYRNYTLDDGAFDIPQRRSSAYKGTPDMMATKASQQAYFSDATTSSGKGSSVGLTTDDDGVTPYEEGSVDSDLHESQVTFNPLHSPTAMPPLPNDLKHQIGLATSRDADDPHHLKSREGLTSPLTPPPRSAGRLASRTNYEVDEAQQEAVASKQDRNDGEATPKNSMPEFFSLSIFQVVLRNPAIAHQLLKFGQTRLCGEHMEFLAKVNKYHLLLHEVSKSISGIYEEFFAQGSPKYLNVPQTVNEKVNKGIKSSINTTLPTLEMVFSSAQDVERTIYGDIYPQFVRHQMSVSAAKALGGDRGKYAGLGDCFVLTDPTKADNPIVFASDGFVKVTGHPRKEIIPRNCRFLQSPQTDRAAVQRIKDAIDRREESVELLLNQKKNGEPFWNLLYVTPLFGHDGKLAFFLGGQINCSTTIHSTSDVLRILALSRNEDEDSRTSTAQPKPPPGPSRSIRRPFASTNRSSIQQRAPGMEDTLVDRLTNLPLTSQFREFYTAYSNFIVINYSSMLIDFVSGGIIDLLFPIKAKSAYHALAVGTDIFKFLGNHGSGSSVSWEFRSSVKNALKMGQAVSLELKLCAKPSMGFEKFLLHWTPLKDEMANVKWIVLTLGNEQRA